MLVRFFNHGKVKKGAVTRTGGGNDVRDYLLFDTKDKNKARENARLIYGDDAATTEVINGIKNSKIYTSGVLSFAPEESLTEVQKIELIESFEQNLFPGMTAGEYSGYWVEHLDKERQELHFVFADIHLPTGRALPVYYHGKDLALVDSWKDLINHDYGLEDPNDPKRQRAYHLKGYEYALKKQDQQATQAREPAKQQGQPTALKDNTSSAVIPRKFDEEEIGNWLVGEIIDDESIQTQADIVAVIGKVFEVTRVAKDGKSISIKNPAGGRNIKLKGMMYAREFSRERFESLGKAQTGKVVERADLVERNRIEVERRFQRLQQRFKQYYQQLAELNRDIKLEPHQPSPANGGPAYRVSESAFGGFDDAVAADPAGFDKSYRAGESIRAEGGEPDSRAETNATRVSDPEQNRDSRLRSGTAATSESQYAAERDTVSDVLSSTDQATSDHASESGYSGMGHLLSGDVADGGDVGHGVLQSPSDERAESGIGTDATSSADRRAESGNDYGQGTANAHRGTGVEHDNGIAQRPEPLSDTDYPQEPASGRLWAEPEGTERAGGRTRNLSDQQEGYQQPFTQPIAAQLVEHTQGTYDGGLSQPERAYRPKLTDIVERFAQADGESNSASHESTETATRPGVIRINTDLVGKAITDYQGGSRAAEPAHAGPGRSLLERINEHQSTATRNAQIRQGRVSNLTSEDENRLEPAGPAIATRRQRGQKFAEPITEIDEQLTDTGDQLADLTTVYDQRTGGFIRTHRRARNAKNRYGQYAHEFKTTTDEYGKLATAISTLVKAVIELFKGLYAGLRQKAYCYADQGLLHVRNPDGSQGRQATTSEATAYIDSHPYDLSGYMSLELTVQNWDRQKKEHDNKPKFRSFGM